MDFSNKYHRLKKDVLQQFWGYQEFRENQEEIIDSIVQGKDTLVLLPTGGGKSLCYQIPAMILEGTCIVVSPLVALMKDQVQHLKSLGIEAEYISSELDDYVAEEIFTLCRQGITKLLYVSPERLANRFFLENLADIPLSILAVDEAHCISEWGQDFRPSYQNINEFRKTYPLPCIALTATATKPVLKQIIDRLALQNPQIFIKSFLRSNISILPDQLADKYQRILNLLNYHQGSGLIYTKKRKEAEDLYQFLKKHLDSRVDYYHAGLTSKEKNYRQSWWQNSSNNVLIATNAFGMGIDKNNVRFVIHLSAPASLENYYQEIGRSGRDGNPGLAYLLWNERELNDFDQILKYQIPTKSEFGKIVSHLYSIFQVADGELPDEHFQLSTQQLAKTTGSTPAKIFNVLNFLHNQEIIFWKAYKSSSSLELKIDFNDLELLPKKDSYFVELLSRNIPGLGSKKVYYSDLSLAKKLETDPVLLRERIKDLQKSDVVTYLDGNLAQIKFIKPRNDRAFTGKLWTLFEQIQKNKITKWEEMKYFIRDKDRCKMRLILSYFGEKNTKNCGKCSVCLQGQNNFLNDRTPEQILQILQQKPATAAEISLQLYFISKEKILENLILLLDAGKVKMLNFQTYTIA